VDKNRECIANGECRPRHRSRKNRSKWCGGHEGREHRYVWTDDCELPNAHGAAWNRDRWRGEEGGYCNQTELCTVCKKQRGWRTVCHCGFIGKGCLWGLNQCPQCGYAPYWPQTALTGLYTRARSRVRERVPRSDDRASTGL
jgi:hypothetical protein